MPRANRRVHAAAAIFVVVLTQAPSVLGADSPFPPGDEPPEPVVPSTPTDPNEGKPYGDGDVVETIPSSADQPTVPTGAPGTATDSHFQSSGYARQSFELVYGELLRRGRGEANPLLWRDAFVSRTQLLLRASYLRGRSFESTVSGLLGYTLHVASEAPSYSVGRIPLQRGEVESELRDAYLGFYWPGVELRIGQQRVAWGRADFQSPNDVINARDLRDPFLTETELRHLPTPVARFSVSGGAVTFEIVASPFFVPDRYDVYGSNWAAVQGRAPVFFQQFIGSASTLVDPTIDRDFAALLRQTERPALDGKGASAGAKLTASLPGLDVDAYYHYGFDSLPFLSVDPSFTQYLNTTNFKPGAASQFAPVLNLLESGIQPFSARYIRRHHVGFDLATSAGPVALRLDAAYESNRVLYNQDLTSFASPAVLAVASFEYQTGALDETLLLELLGMRVLDRPRQTLLIYDQNSAALAATFRWPIAGSWGIDVRALVGIKPQTYVVRPALSYDPDGAFSIKLGAVALGGKPDSLGWYFEDNDSAFVQFRYAF